MAQKDDKPLIKNIAFILSISLRWSGKCCKH